MIRNLFAAVKGKTVVACSTDNNNRVTLLFRDGTTLKFHVDATKPCDFGINHKAPAKPSKSKKIQKKVEKDLSHG